MSSAADAYKPVMNMDTLPSKHNERGGTFLKRVCLLFHPEKELTSFQTSFLLALIGLLALAGRGLEALA